MNDQMDMTGQDSDSLYILFESVTDAVVAKARMRSFKDALEQDNIDEATWKAVERECKTDLQGARANFMQAARSLMPQFA